MEASAPQVAERPLWELNRGEQRILIITFVGGVASIVAAACIVGAGIALARALKAASYSPIDQFLYTLVFAGAVVAIIIYIRIVGLRRDWLAWSLVMLSLFAFCIFLLGSIGLAAGIH